jgi:hypothetical protein
VQGLISPLVSLLNATLEKDSLDEGFVSMTKSQ